MLAHAAVCAVEFLVQSKPISVHLRFGFVADIQRTGVVFGSESGDFCFAESDDFPCLGIDHFAETVPFYFHVLLRGEGQVDFAVCSHVGSSEELLLFGHGAGADVLHAMLVEVNGACGVFWVGGVSVGEDMVDDFVLESGEFDFDEAWDVIGKCCGCDEWLVHFDQRVGG
jgi:hypothetical protein